MLITSLGVLFLLSAHLSAQTGPKPATNSISTWKSANGKHAIEVEESAGGIGDMVHGGGYVAFPPFVLQVKGIVINADGKSSELWTWVPPKKGQHIAFQIAHAIVGDSGKRSILIARETYDENSTPFGKEFWAPEILILDDKGNEHAQVKLDDWIKIFGPKGKVDGGDGMKVQLVENELTLKMTLSSGSVALVNTDTGECTSEAKNVEHAVQSIAPSHAR
jgi:hypothetical protein